MSHAVVVNVGGDVCVETEENDSAVKRYSASAVSICVLAFLS